MQGAEAALWGAGLHSERMAGTEEEECETSAVIDQRQMGAGPEREPQGIPEGSWRVDEACEEDLVVVGVAWGAWAHDGGWVETGVGLRNQEAESESEVNEETVTSEGEATPQTGLETWGWSGTEAEEVERWKQQWGPPVEAGRGLRLQVELVL